MRATLAALALGLFAASPATASEYAPPDTPGPELSVAKPELRHALRCRTDVEGARQDPVLLVPGTTLNPEAEFRWSWEPALARLGRPFCSLTLPGNAMAGIQLAGEYVVHALRRMHRLSGRRADIVGHSQGGMVPRWALRFWPGTRRLVDDLVGLAPSNHGTVDANVVCAPGCAPAFWQQRRGSAFLQALNSYAETFAGVSYTVVYTRIDEVVVPNGDGSGSSPLRGGRGEVVNVALQDVCPLNLSEHLAIGTYDNVAYELALDAITHPGPADPGRLGAAVCQRSMMPGVDPQAFVADYGKMLTVVADTVLRYPHVPAEPELAAYTKAG